MTAGPILHDFDRRLVMLGFGRIGQAVLPLLPRHLAPRFGPGDLLLNLSVDVSSVALLQ
jgi:hypothetical protein